MDRTSPSFSNKMMVNIVAKKCKNVVTWNGLTRMATLTKLITQLENHVKPIENMFLSFFWDDSSYFLRDSELIVARWPRPEEDAGSEVWGDPRGRQRRCGLVWCGKKR